MEKYEYWLGMFKDKYTGKEEYVSEYQKHTDGKYYASNYFSRLFSEYTNTKGKFIAYVRESNSILYNYSLENIEVIHFKNFKKETNLNRINYNPEFWESYNPEEMME